MSWSHLRRRSEAMMGGWCDLFKVIYYAMPIQETARFGSSVTPLA